MKSLSLSLGAVALFVSACLAASATASVVEFSGDPIPFEGVPLAPVAKVGNTTLKLNGKGLRRKFAVVKVYVAAAYFSDHAQFCGRAAKSVADAVNAEPVKVFQLTMKRSLSAKELRDAFEEALFDYNNVPQNAPGIQEVLSQLAMDLPSGASAVIVGENGKNGVQKLTIEAMGKSGTVEAPGLVDTFFKIWFGKGESAILSLQKQLVGCP